jgi:DNA-binding IclR family transcriptional regulator
VDTQPVGDITPPPSQSVVAQPSTTERVAHILLAFAGKEEWLGISEIARRVDLSKAVVHRIVRTLVETGILAYGSEQRLYRLGPAAYALGRAAARGDQLREAAMPEISHLSRISGETTTLSATMGHERCYIGQVESSQEIRITITLGQRVPLTAGASGLAILAFMPARDIELALSTPLPQYTVRTQTDVDGIRRRLENIRSRGWASSEGERVRMSSSIAAPVFDINGTPVGAVSLAYIEARIVGKSREALADQVLTAAANSSLRLQESQKFT